MLNKINFFISKARECIESLKDFMKDFRARKKEKKTQAENKALRESFNFILNPYQYPERYIVISGDLYRVIFKQEGIAITDANGGLVENEITSLRVLEQLSKYEK